MLLFFCEKIIIFFYMQNMLGDDGELLYKRETLF